MVIAAGAVFCGVAMLALAADQFVLGAARVALVKRVPSLVVGVVIVGFGTSAPELLVSSLAALGDEPEVAVGNIVGSNLANLSLLLGAGAILVPLSVDSRTVRREALLVIGAVVLFGLVVQGGGISRVEGAGLVAAMVVTLIVVTRPSPKDPLSVEVVELADPDTHRFQLEVIRTVTGLFGTTLSAQLLLWGALKIAQEADLSEGFVGATMVAIGTSLPELVTVIQSARREETDLIVGNLLGSNLFNALAVGGTVGLIGGPSIDNPALTVTAVVATIAIAATAAAAMRSGHTVTRTEGGFLIVCYLAFSPFLL